MDEYLFAMPGHKIISTGASVKGAIASPICKERALYTIFIPFFLKFIPIPIIVFVLLLVYFV